MAHPDRGARTLDVAGLPAGLVWLRASEAGRAWLASLPGLVSECARQWALRLHEPFGNAYASFAMGATLRDETSVVLKVQFPDRESRDEAAALAQWDGDGAIRLIAHDPGRHALLLERCVPGTPLAALGQDAALDALIRLLPRLWKPAGEPFQSLACEAARWADGLAAKWERAGRPFERALLDATLDALRTLPGSQGEQVLLHQDLHAENVLHAEREPWLVIDPKPLAGEREFGLAPIVRSVALGNTRADVQYRLDRLSGELGLDRERARMWSLAQTVAWSFGSEHFRRHVAVARWLAEAD